MTKTYTITAGNNSTDLGVVGHAETLIGAKRIGRVAVRDSLPNGQGNYKVRDAEGLEVLVEEYSVRTDYRWLAR